MTIFSIKRSQKNRFRLPVNIQAPLRVITIGVILSLSACTTTPKNLYNEMGGQLKIEEVTNNFIEQIGYNKHIVRYFENTDINRFREKLNEHLCMVADGPCVYTGDSMLDVHAGMNINENHFNLMVDLLINAMDDANIPHNTQNKMLAKLATMRSDIIYK
jgi:hemoglobin